MASLRGGNTYNVNGRQNPVLKHLEALEAKNRILEEEVSLLKAAKHRHSLGIGLLFLILMAIITGAFVHELLLRMEIQELRAKIDNNPSGWYISLSMCILGAICVTLICGTLWITNRLFGMLELSQENLVRVAENGQETMRQAFQSLKEMAGKMGNYYNRQSYNFSLFNFFGGGK